MCLNEVISSFHLFTEATSKLQIMKYFSERHTLHPLKPGLMGQLTLKSSK